MIKTVYVKIALLFLPLTFTGCSHDLAKNRTPPLWKWQTIQGRDEGIPEERFAIYRAKVPNHWEQKHPMAECSIADSTLPNCTFLIHEHGQSIRITVHSFPSDALENRIPPNAQVARWKRQFTEIDPISITVVPKAYGGFAGLLFEASGQLKDLLFEGSGAVYAWSMQLDPHHYQILSYLSTTQQKRQLYLQMRADYTIKAVGPVDLMEKNHEEISNFAHSFELIQPIPEAL